MTSANEAYSCSWYVHMTYDDVLYTNDSAMFSYFPISVGKICNCQAWVGVHSDTVETAVDPVQSCQVMAHGRHGLPLYSIQTAHTGERQASRQRDSYLGFFTFSIWRVSIQM